MLKRIKIEGYKSFDKLDIQLENLVVLFGPNASGKSNFLDALRLLSRLPNAPTPRDAFFVNRGFPLESFRFGLQGIKGLLRRKSLSMVLEADIQLSDAVIEWVKRGLSRFKPAPQFRNSFLRYRIKIAMEPAHGFMNVLNESLVALTEEGEIDRKELPFLRSTERVCVLRHEQTGEQVKLAAGKKPSSIFSSDILSFPDHLHLLALKTELKRWNFFYFEPFVGMRLPSPLREVSTLDVIGGDLAAYLNTLKAVDPGQFTAIEEALRILIPSVSKIQVEVNKQGEVELSLFEGSAEIPARLLSEGTLRILGFLAVLGTKDAPTLIGFEEPENGINPRRIKLIAELIRNRSSIGDAQLIVTTHSPLLPDLIPDENLYVCGKRHGATTIEPFRDWGPLGRGPAINKHLNGEEGLSKSDRILRGDFDE